MTCTVFGFLRWGMEIWPDLQRIRSKRFWAIPINFNSLKPKNNEQMSFWKVRVASLNTNPWPDWRHGNPIAIKSDLSLSPWTYENRHRGLFVSNQVFVNMKWCHRQHWNTAQQRWMVHFGSAFVIKMEREEKWGGSKHQDSAKKRRNFGRDLYGH